MSVTSKTLKRVFRSDGTEYPDPSPSSSPQEVLGMLAMGNPAMNNADLEGPSIEAGKQVFTIKENVGTKG